MNTVLCNRTCSFIRLTPWCLVMFLCLFLSMATRAEVSTLEHEAHDTFFEISELVVDETRTVAGRRFFEGLATRLTELGGQTENIVVNELADPRFGSRLSVNVGPTLVFRRFLSPRLGDVDQAVERALAQVHRAMHKQQRLQEELEMY